MQHTATKQPEAADSQKFLKYKDFFKKKYSYTKRFFHNITKLKVKPATLAMPQTITIG